MESQRVRQHADATVQTLGQLLQQEEALAVHQISTQPLLVLASLVPRPMEELDRGQAADAAAPPRPLGRTPRNPAPYLALMARLLETAHVSAIRQSP